MLLILLNKHINVDGMRYDISYGISNLLNLCGRHRSVPEDIQFAWRDSVVTRCTKRQGAYNKRQYHTTAEQASYNIL